MEQDNNNNINDNNDENDNIQQNKVISTKLRQGPKTYYIKRDNENNAINDDNIIENKEKKNIDKTEEDKRKAERVNRALMRVKRNQEKRKEEERNNNFHKSLKVTNLAKELENSMKKQKDKEKETIEQENDDNNNYDNNNDENDDNKPKYGEAKSRRFKRRSKDEN